MKLKILCLALVLFSASAYSAANEMEIYVGGPGHRANYAFVTVTVCEPGTSRCQTIPDIQLDSGSTGLRIFGSKLNVPFSPVTGAGQALGECKIFGGGDVLWGPVGKLDVVLGGTKAKNVPVQIIDTDFGSVPDDCHHPRTQIEQWSHGNGILGVGPALSDCGGQACNPAKYIGARYYTCQGDSCKEFPAALGQQVQNPVVFLSDHANGLVLKFPPAPARNQESSYRAKLVLGIGTAPNNQPPKNLKVLSTERMGWVQFLVGKKKYWGKIDTGADLSSLPLGWSGLPHCADSGDWSYYLCPERDTSIPVTVMSLDENIKAEVMVNVSNARRELAEKTLFQTGAVYEFGGLTSDVMLLGFPFFLGRDFYIGIDGTRSELGDGAFYAF